MIIKVTIFLVAGAVLSSANFLNPDLEESGIFNDEDIYANALPTVIQNDTGMTFPGTKWCGPGDVAMEYNDLGIYAETDKCCRTHDHCFGFIQAGETVNGLHNDDWFPRLHCDCEQAFIDCLQSVNDYVSLSIGKTYFSARRYCYKFEHPALLCTGHMGMWFWKRCVKYVFDTNLPKEWQWFQMPYYTTDEFTQTNMPTVTFAPSFDFN